MNHGLMAAAVALLVVACGGNSASNDGDEMAGSGGTGGSAAGNTPGGAGAGTAGKANGGGSSASGNAAGGSTAMGGTASGGSAGSKSNDPAPAGSVYACFGGCPMGACDNDKFWADIECSEVYPAPVNASSSYCDAGANSGYCLDLGTGSFDSDFYAVTCANGVASFDHCLEGGCSSTSGSAECI